MTRPLGLPSTQNSRSMSGLSQKVQLSVCQLLKKKYEAHLASHPKPISFKVVQVYAVTNKIVAVMDYTDHHTWKGKGLVIYVYDPDADDWKVRLFYKAL